MFGPYKKICRDCDRGFESVSRNKIYCGTCARSRILKCKREYAHKNAAKLRAYAKTYYTLDKYYASLDNIIARKIRTHKTHDIKSGRGVPREYITRKWVKKTLKKQKRRCKYCNRKMKVDHLKSYDMHSFSVERVDNAKPHTKGNCICVCLDCNRKRGSKDQAEYLAGLL